jgi:hypothetical protein
MPDVTEQSPPGAIRGGFFVPLTRGETVIQFKIEGAPF